ncbi:CocE/NonD family hydrolase [Bacillus salipaludis]|uniref:CocE/NonD family hydrolase n=1 Tax=Bacillus salipaludis TaxID=2547811 RepID=A0A4R5VIQ4_9BACI|nr:CocE/NonD family hydrolase [Bacillus salipaludis]MDQ6595569.1 CocE/NonD family hydrolase [Bacillus salipaludis]TDK56281.1 CocE/NonD family hydrolase [Bacillus salipaludis]
MKPIQILVEKNVPCEMRDGVILYADIYRPNEEGTFPVLLTRLPYSKDLPHYSHRYLDTNRLVENGFVVIIQDVRGRFQSEGEFQSFRQEANDGYDTVEWAASLPFSTGKVGMFGMSYYGYTQLMAATKRPPHLAAIFPAMTLNDQRNGASYRNGVYQPGFTETWTLESIAPDLLMRKYGEPKKRADALRSLADQLNKLDELYQFAPVNQWLPLKELKVAEFFFEELEHPIEDDDYWKESSIIDKYEDLQIPAYHLGGWYDCFIGPTLTNYSEMTKTGKHQKLIVGPWGHGYFASIQGECSFGVHASGDWIDLGGNITDLHIRWFNHWLKGIDIGLEAEPPVRIFVMGINEWRDEWEWPLARTQYTNFYLHSSGKANTKNGDGELSLMCPVDEAFDSYLYDPKNPVPTKGGSTLFAGPLTMGPFDQREIEEREDVLVYSTEPLTEAIEVTGQVKVKLWASTDAKDTDFTAKLVDTAPDGKALILTEGIVNAKYRNGFQPEKELTGEVVEYEIDLWATSNVFLQGHRITLEISSSSSPHYLPNPNTGNSLVESKQTRTAKQTIFHNEQYPSKLILPVVPVDK